MWNLKSWALESWIQLKESGILLTIGIQNLSSTDKYWNQMPGIRNPRRGIHNPGLVDYPRRGEKWGGNCILTKKTSWNYLLRTLKRVYKTLLIYGWNCLFCPRRRLAHMFTRTLLKELFISSPVTQLISTLSFGWVLCHATSCHTIIWNPIK